jgi:hypothetical protein
MVDTKAMSKSTKYKVTMAVTRLDGLPSLMDKQDTATVEVRWQGKRYGLFSFLPGRKKRVSLSRRKQVERGGSVHWERAEEAARLENISVFVSGFSFHSSSDSPFDRETVDYSPDVSFSVRLVSSNFISVTQFRIKVGDWISALFLIFFFFWEV